MSNWRMTVDGSNNSHQRYLRSNKLYPFMGWFTLNLTTFRIFNVEEYHANLSAYSETKLYTKQSLDYVFCENVYIQLEY